MTSEFESVDIHNMKQRSMPSTVKREAGSSINKIAEESETQLYQFKSLISRESRGLLEHFPKGTIVFTKDKEANSVKKEFELTMSPEKIDLILKGEDGKEKYSYGFVSKLLIKNLKVLDDHSKFYEFANQLVEIYDLIADGSCVYSLKQA